MIWFGDTDTNVHFFWVDAFLHMGIFTPIKYFCENAK